MHNPYVPSSDDYPAWGSHALTMRLVWVRRVLYGQLFSILLFAVLFRTPLRDWWQASTVDFWEHAIHGGAVGSLLLFPIATLIAVSRSRLPVREQDIAVMGTILLDIFALAVLMAVI